MEDLAIQEPNKLAEAIIKTLEEARLEVISRSGLITSKSYIGHSSILDTLLMSTNYSLYDDFVKILNSDMPTLDKALQEYKDKFVNKFMTSHHEYVVRPSKYNWNWD